MGDGPVDLPAFFVKVFPGEIPVKQGFQERWLAPEHCSSGETELAVSCDVVEIEACQEGIGFFVVAIFMTPAGIVFNPKADGVVLNWIDNSCLWGLKGFEVGCCDGSLPIRLSRQ